MNPRSFAVLQRVLRRDRAKMAMLMIAPSVAPSLALARIPVILPMALVLMEDVALSAAQVLSLLEKMVGSPRYSPWRL